MHQSNKAIITAVALLCVIATALWYTPASHLPWLPLSNISPFQATQNTDLIVYSYSHSTEADKNVDFFLHHALHSKADFIFLLNSAHNITLPSRPNIRAIERENRCFDLGGYHEVLAAEPDLLKKYSRFIMLNASLRGPFLPSWADGVCWSDAYWRKLSARVRVVGMTYNCAKTYSVPVAPHVQSMILATDQAGMAILMENWKCFENLDDAVGHGEVPITAWIRDAGYDVYAMMAAFAGHGGGDDSADYAAACEGHWVFLDKAYDGVSLHPFDTL